MIHKLKKLEATSCLIMINIFMFVITQAKGGNTTALLDLGGMFPPYIVVYHQYWRILTAGFLHANSMHIILNMFSLYMVGQILEPFFQKERFLLIYLMSTITGNLLTFAFGSWASVSIGASSAIFGMFIIIVLLARLMPYHSGVRLVSQQFISIIVINLLFSFAPGINMYGHLGGMLGGVFAFYALGYFKNNRHKMLLVYFSFVIVCVFLYWYGMNRLY